MVLGKHRYKYAPTLTFEMTDEWYFKGRKWILSKEGKCQTMRWTCSRG